MTMTDCTTRIRIPERLFAPAETERFEGTCELPVLKAGPDLYSFAEPLAWAVDVTNTGDAILVSGTVEGQAATACGRCLADAAFDLMGEVEGYFVIGTEDQASDLDEDECDVLPDDRTIDLLPLIQAALLLELPLLPLCQDDCQGLCPTCGQNLNEGPCDCAPADAGEEPAPQGPFAKLADLKLD